MGVACLHVAVLTTLLVTVDTQGCGPIQGIPRKRLVNHVYRVMMDSERFNCFRECGIDKTCQSHNFLYDEKICELNNRTKEASPDDLVYHHSAYYMDRSDPVPLGSIPELPGNTCKEIKLSTPGSKTGRYWIDPENSNKPLHVVCNMTMEDVDECESGTHVCHANAKCTNTKGSYECACKPGFVGNGTVCIVAKNCAEVLKRGVNTSGVYTVKPDSLGPAFQVYCDETTSGGGWTVFQKRQDGSVDFYRGWSDYKTGFGNLTGEFWLGLDKIYRLTNQARNVLRVELEDTTGNSAYAKYDDFVVSSENDKYRLSLGTYTGNAGNSLKYHQGQPFTTKDHDNDDVPNGNCAVSYKGAWWYKHCHRSNLNGLYHNGAHSSIADGVNWLHWKGHHYSAKRAEMKIRPVGFKTN